MERTEAVIAREEAKAFAAIAAYKPRFQGKRCCSSPVREVLVRGRGASEAGLELVGTSVKKSTRADKERIKELMGQDAHMIEDMTPREMYKMLKDAKADIMLLRRPLAIHRAEAADAWLDIKPGTPHAYMGYVGMGEAGGGDRQGALQPHVGAGAQSSPWDRPAKCRLGTGPDGCGSRRARSRFGWAAEAARRAKKVCQCKSVDSAPSRMPSAPTAFPR